MIDTHCHLLPGLDDGPETEDGAIAIARSLVASGVQSVLCTPHYSRSFPTDHLDALEREASLVSALAREGLALETTVAAEVSPELAISADSAQLLARSISGRFLLVELLPETPGVALATIAARLEKLGLLPVFAHPERCRALHRHPGPLDAARSEGALAQVVAPSLTGRWGEDVAAAAWRIVSTGRADLIASDAHRRRRRSALVEAAELVSDRLGEHTWWELTDRRPALTVRGVHPEEAR